MKNIIYFTTSQHNDDYEQYTNIWKTPINSSNQIFHNKMIRSLSFSYHVDVISIRPFSTDKCVIDYLDKGERISSSIFWHYLKIKRNKVLRLASCYHQANKIIKKLCKNSIILTSKSITVF